VPVLKWYGTRTYCVRCRYSNVMMYRADWVRWWHWYVMEHRTYWVRCQYWNGMRQEHTALGASTLMLWCTEQNGLGAGTEMLWSTEHIGLGAGTEMIWERTYYVRCQYSVMMYRADWVSCRHWNGMRQNMACCVKYRYWNVTRQEHSALGACTEMLRGPNPPGWVPARRSVVYRQKEIVPSGTSLCFKFTLICKNVTLPTSFITHCFLCRRTGWHTVRPMPRLQCFVIDQSVSCHEDDRTEQRERERDKRKENKINKEKQ
jgi:hypothetical protein